MVREKGRVPARVEGRPVPSLPETTSAGEDSRSTRWGPVSPFLSRTPPGIGGRTTFVSGSEVRCRVVRSRPVPPSTPTCMSRRRRAGRPPPRGSEGRPASRPRGTVGPGEPSLTLTGLLFCWCPGLFLGGSEVCVSNVLAGGGEYGGPMSTPLTSRSLH